MVNGTNGKNMKSSRKRDKNKGNATAPFHDGSGTGDVGRKKESTEKETKGGFQRGEPLARLPRIKTLY